MIIICRNARFPHIPKNGDEPIRPSSVHYSHISMVRNHNHQNTIMDGKVKKHDRNFRVLYHSILLSCVNIKSEFFCVTVKLWEHALIIVCKKSSLTPSMPTFISPRYRLITHLSMKPKKRHKFLIGSLRGSFVA